MVVFIKSIKWHQSMCVLVILVHRKLVCGGRVGGDIRVSMKQQQRYPHFSWWLLWLPSFGALESRRLRTGGDCCWVEKKSFVSVCPWQVIYSKLYLYPGLVGRTEDTNVCKPCGPVCVLSRWWLSPSACFPQWYRLHSTTCGTCLLNQCLVSEWNRSSFHQVTAAYEHS